MAQGVCVIFKNIEILYEDNHLLVVNKPVNMLTQSDNTKDPDLLSLMKEYLRVTYNKPGEAYLGMVHRLDRVTGGVIVFAKTSKAASRLSNQIRLNEWKKSYIVITDNIPKQTKGTMTDYLYKDRKTNNSYVSIKGHKDSKKAVLHFEHVASQKNKSLIDIDLITGRTHQIRVQLSSRNLPIYGDYRYNKNVRKNSQIKLFAYRLEIIHPTLKEPMVFEAMPPQHGLWNEFYSHIKMI